MVGDHGARTGSGAPTHHAHQARRPPGLAQQRKAVVQREAGSVECARFVRGVVARVGHGNFIGDFHFGELGDGINARQLHLLRNRCRPHIECAAEYEWEAQNIVDLVRVI